MIIKSVIYAFNTSGLADSFFTPFFEKLVEKEDIRKMIMDGKIDSDIQATLKCDVEKFKQQRKKYLLYAE